LVPITPHNSLQLPIAPARAVGIRTKGELWGVGRGWSRELWGAMGSWPKMADGRWQAKDSKFLSPAGGIQSATSATNSQKALFAGGF